MKKNQRYFKNDQKGGKPAPKEKEEEQVKNTKINEKSSPAVAEDKLKKKKEEEEFVPLQQDEQSDSSDSESSGDDNDSDSDFEAIKKEEGGSSRYRMALALRDTFQVYILINRLNSYSPSLYSLLKDSPLQLLQ